MKKLLSLNLLLSAAVISLSAHAISVNTEEPMGGIGYQGGYQGGIGYQGGEQGGIGYQTGTGYEGGMGYQANQPSGFKPQQPMPDKGEVGIPTGEVPYGVPGEVTTMPIYEKPNFEDNTPVRTLPYEE
jgi:hypothetical protein